MSEKWQVKKAGPSLAIEDMIERMLGAEFAVEDFDPSRPLAQQVDKAEVLLVRSMPVTREVIDAAPRLRLIQRPGVHLEGVDLDYAAAKGIPVCNVPASLTHGGEDVAEHVMFLALALAKRYRESLESLGRFWTHGESRRRHGARVRHGRVGSQTHAERGNARNSGIGLVGDERSSSGTSPPK
jgi:lactate dehydrogenase-like 2-hydroxyacid dehydrogenase